MPELILNPFAGFRVGITTDPGVILGPDDWNDLVNGLLDEKHVSNFGNPVQFNDDDVVAGRDPDGQGDLARSGLVFDTTIVPEGAIVSDVRLRMRNWDLGLNMNPEHVSVRTCQFVPGGGNYQTFDNFMAVWNGTHRGILHDVGDKWDESDNLAAAFSRSPTFSLGFKHLVRDIIVTELPPVFIDHRLWTNITDTNKPRLVITYEAGASPSTRLPLAGVGT